MPTPKEMTQQEMRETLAPQVKLLQDYSRTLSEAAERFRRMLDQGDVTFDSIQAASQVIDSCTEINVREMMHKIRRTLGARGKSKIREFGAY